VKTSGVGQDTEPKFNTIVIWFIWFVSFVWLNQIDQMNRQTNLVFPQPARAQPLLILHNGGLR
jgi:hypothetical protein